MIPTHRTLCLRLFDAALDAARPEKILPKALPAPPTHANARTIVVGMGKGAAQLAQILERVWPTPLSGLVVTRYGFGADTNRIAVREAGHPVPDQQGLAAAAEIKRLLTGLKPEDMVIALVCGGGSALLPAPPEGITLDDEIALNQNLLASGLPIGSMNTIRSAFSTLKAGRLATLAAPAPVHSLIVSDVPGDDPGLIASGPTVPSATHTRMIDQLLAHPSLTLPEAMQRYRQAGKITFPDPKDPVFHNHHWQVIASAGLSLEAARRAGEQAGYPTHILSDRLEGDARTVARSHGAEIRRLHQQGQRGLWLSGGELTMTLTNGATTGSGGPNSSYVLALAQEIAGLDRVSVFAADSDGIDGKGKHAGGFADGSTIEACRTVGVDPDSALRHFDSATALDKVGSLFSPGPTGTNVNDIRAWILGF